MSKQTLKSTLGDLVAFKTITGDYEAAAEALSYIKQRAGTAWHVKELVNHDYPSLLLTSQPTQRPKITLLAHIDVVPAEDDQFRLISDGDKLYGRGVYDMKFAIACYLQLVGEIGDQLHNYDLGLLITSDEETGGQFGVKTWLDNGYYTNACVVPDGGDNWQIEQHAKGFWTFKILCQGASTHSSRPWTGDNAAHKLINCLYQLQQLNINQPEGTTISINGLEAGRAMTQVPDFAQATIDIRYMDLKSYEKIHEQVKNLVEQYGGQLETLVFADSAHTDLANPLVQQFTQIASNVAKRPIKPILSYGGTDGRYFTSKDIPTIIMRPSGGNAHGATEWISQSSLEEYYQVIKQFVLQASKIT